MAQRKILARGWVFELSDGETSPSYLPIAGLNTWTRSRDKNDADVTDFDDSGWTQHIVASRGNSINFDGFFLIDPDTGTRDPGQALVEALAELIDYDSIRAFRYYHEATGIGEAGDVSASINDVGGGNDDPTSWGCTLTFSGQVLPYDHSA